MLRYDGRVWSQEVVGTGADLVALWGTAGELYALGVGGLLLSVRGTATRMEHLGRNLRAVGGTPAGGAVAVGDRGEIFRWDGNRWSAEHRSITAARLLGGWDGGAGHVWAVGPVGEALHHDGASWRRVPLPPQAAPVAVWGSGPADLWAVGNGVFHFDGQSWQAVPAPEAQLYGVWGSGPRNVWAVGSRGALLHYDGVSWRPMPLPQSVRRDLTLASVAGSGPSDVWAVGEAGTILHHDGSAWQAVPAPAEAQGAFLTAVWAADAAHAWIVAANGMLLRHEGGRWSALPQSAPLSGLRALWGSGPSDVWAVGQGVLLHHDGQRWISLPPVGDMALNAVFGSGATMVRLLGDRGTILRLRR